MTEKSNGGEPSAPDAQANSGRFRNITVNPVHAKTSRMTSTRETGTFQRLAKRCIHPVPVMGSMRGEDRPWGASTAR